MTTPALGDTTGWRSFTAGVVALLGTRDPLDVLAELAPTVRELIAGSSDARLRAPEAPGKWSVAAVIDHLVDVELVFGYRLRQVLTHDRPVLPSFDQDGWAARGAYGTGDIASSLLTLELLRARHLALWRSLSPADWSRIGIHGDRGPESLAELVRINAGHDLSHRQQIARILATGTPGSTSGA